MALDLARGKGHAFVSPYNDPWVVAGQGTIGLEILEDAPQLSAVLVPVGGGGMISGIGSWLKRVNPNIRVIGVQSTASPAMERALKAGMLVEIGIEPTLADGLAANIQTGSITFDLARELVDDLVLVTEDEIASTIRACFHELHLALEGSAVVTVAGLLAGRIEGIAGTQVAAVITGRNIASERLVQLLSAVD
jgi:threonine dehydratase